MTVSDITYTSGMVRWEPDGRGRLEQAAMALYAERGFENTTVAEIADRAGLTERTFFRHYADKREVLFAGSSQLQDLLETTVADAPADLAPIDAVARGVEAIAGVLQGRRDFARRRQAIIAASPELQERELTKLATLSAATAAVHGDAGALQRCGARVRTGQTDDLVAGVEELLGGGGADEAARPGDEDAHCESSDVSD